MERTCIRCGILFESEKRRICDACRRSPAAYVRPVLSPRQRQVVALVAQALPNKEIARELRLTEETVKQYLQRIQLKLGLRNRTHLAIWTTQHDLSCPLSIP